MRVSVDAASCVGHGRCYTFAPEVFEPDEFGHCVVALADVPEELLGEARRALCNCPETAIASRNRGG